MPGLEVEEEDVVEEEEINTPGDEIDKGRVFDNPEAGKLDKWGEDEDSKSFPALSGVCGWETGRTLPLKALLPPGVSVWVCTMLRRFCRLLAVAFVWTLLPLEERRGMWPRLWVDEEEGVVSPGAAAGVGVGGVGVAGTDEEEGDGMPRLAGMRYMPPLPVQLPLPPGVAMALRSVFCFGWKGLER